MVQDKEIMRIPTVAVFRGPDYVDTFTIAQGAGKITVRDFVTANFGEDFATPTICIYEGKPLLRADWDKTLIVCDVVFHVLPTKSMGKMFGTLFVVALAAAATWWVGGVGGLAIGGTLGLGAVAGAIAGIAVLLGGMMLLNALFPTKLPGFESFGRDLEAASPTYSHSGSMNRARLYQMIPEGFGTNLQTPDLATQPYIYYTGNEEYLCQLMCIGVGKYRINSIRIEDTIIWEKGASTGRFPEIEVQIVNPGETLTLFPDNIETNDEVAGQSLKKGTLGPFFANSPGTKASHIAIDLQFPNGLVAQNPDAKKSKDALQAHSVGVRFDVREIDNEGAPVGEWRVLFQNTFSNKTRTALRYTYQFDMRQGQTTGRYEVRGYCTSGHEESFYLTNECVWTGLKAVLPSKLVYPDITLIAVKARASNSLGQNSMRMFRVEHSRDLGDWKRERVEKIMPSIVKGDKISLPGHPDDNMTAYAVSGDMEDRADYYIGEVYIEFQKPVAIQAGSDPNIFSDYKKRHLLSNGDYWPGNPFTDTDYSPNGFTFCEASPYTLGNFSFDQFGCKFDDIPVLPQDAADGEEISYVIFFLPSEAWMRSTVAVSDSSGFSNQPAFLKNCKTWLGKKLNYADENGQEALPAINSFILKRGKITAKRTAEETVSGDKPKNSWVSAIKAMLKADWGGRRKDSQLDLEGLARLDEILTARGDEFNQILDTRQTVWQTITESCRCVRVIPRIMFNTIGFIRDQPGRVVRGVFTPYNILRGSFGVDYTFFTEDTPDDVILEYRDRNGWIEREVRAIMPNSLSLEPARKRFTGITDMQHAYREAVFEAACNAYRRIFITFSSEMEGRLLFRGDKILVTHPLGGEGDFAQVRGFDEANLCLEVDNYLPFSPGDKPYIFIRRPDGQPFGPVAVNMVKDKFLWLDKDSLDKANADNNKSLWEFISDGTNQHHEATVITYGLESQGLFAIVTSIRHRKNGQCEIECVIEDERVHTSPGLYQHTLGGTVMPIAVDEVSINKLKLSFEEQANDILIKWEGVAGANAYQAYLRQKDAQGAWITSADTDEDGWSKIYDGQNTSVSISVNGMVQLRVRGVNISKAGEWAYLSFNSDAPRPGALSLSLAKPWTGQELALVWTVPVNTDKISISFWAAENLSGEMDEVDSVLFEKTDENPDLPTSLTITKADFDEYGGASRYMLIRAKTINNDFETAGEDFYLSLVPPRMGQVQAVQSGTDANLSWNVPPEGCTGYIVRHFKPDGSSAQHIVTEENTATLSLPVSSGMQRFEVAAADIFYDTWQDLPSLIFSEPAILYVS